MKNIPKKMSAEAFTNLNYISQYGTKRFLRHSINKARTFQKNIGGEKYLFRRSVTGQGLSTAFSPVGWGVGAALTKRDPTTGKKRGIARRAVGGASFMVAPNLAITGEIAGSIFKRKPRQI